MKKACAHSSAKLTHLSFAPVCKAIIVSSKYFFPIKVLLPAFFLAFLFLIPPALGTQQIEEKKVLVLFSFRPTQPVASQWGRGIRSVFEDSISQKMGVNIEYLDLMHYEDDRLTHLLLDVYRHKYSDPKPDLIIPVFNSAVDLVLNHGSESFPDVPIVFGGVESKFIDKQPLGPLVTGYLTDNNYTRTLDLALNLHPDTRDVVVVAGAGPIGRGWSDACREAYASYQERVNFTYLIGFPLEELLAKIATLPPHTVVISIPINVDGAGKKFFGNESLARITQAANAPVYSFWDVTVGTGIVGGYVSSFEEEGKAVAQLGLRVLNGEKPADIPITKAAPFLYMFDWRQLKRWSIAEDRLPSGSIIKFKELSVWDQHKGRIIFALAMILLQSVAIFYLLVQRRLRRQVERNYQTVADHTFDWEYWENADGSVQYVSPSCERISGYSAQEITANPSLLKDMIHPEDQHIWNQHRCEIQNSGSSEGIQFRIKRPDGQVRWIEHVCQPVFDEQGKNRGIRASNRDITKREYYRSETQKLQTELAHMDRVVTVSALTSALAHEINQPLSAMRSYAQAALRFMNKDEPDSEQVRVALEGIVADNKRAAEVVTRLRKLVSKEPSSREKISINSVVNEVISLLNSELVLKNASLTLDLAPETSMVHVDPVQIQQVLINLITNALDAMEKKSESGRNINISTHEDTLRGFIVVSVSDSGEGIEQEKMETIFSPFVTTKPAGMGLGLSICKSIIEAHNGEMYVRDNPGGGAIFSFTLPME